ncbi:hypothetical protein FE257_000439 [Aspergillus nanangensis]|uniref:Thioesterase domain-containing protein n=1 Tax=Aspergillus nanangensis TaxID=2582783 RepID=A0AAD4CUA5_ASPNN|nr:hypothetical protein FE257_000439 [Aspergillus nanangensis]
MSHQNPLFNKTVTHNDGLKKQLYLLRDELDAQGAPDREGYLLLELGGGVAGQDGIAHGGFLSIVMDQVTGTLIGLTGLEGGLGMYTVALNLSYHKPVFVPSVIIATAKISRIERRRIHVDASIVDMQGDTCTTAEAIFVQKRPETL